MSEMQNKAAEQKRVNSIVDLIQFKISSYLEKTQNVGAHVWEIRQTFWDDVTVNLDEPDDVIETFTSIKQQAELLSERERIKGHLDKQIKVLNRLEKSPYFGRIDFKEEGESEIEPIYLGIASLMDEKDENFIIYDWRAPISSLYYDYSPGAAEYRTPIGRMHGEMTLKRQFIIRNGVIEGMFDTGVTIGDQLLQEVLGNQANSQMKSIVATIQKEQNAIIRNERSKILVVQGVAGSGKTSAALQRAAFLLYRYRETLNSENIMLFSPNPLFNSYVATVLPELGEESMRQTTFQGYLTHRLGNDFQVEDPFTQLEEILTSEDDQNLKIRMTGIALKADLNFKERMDQYLLTLSDKGLVFRDISLKDKVLIKSRQISEQFYSLDSSFSIPNRIQLIQEWLLAEIRQQEKRERKKEWVEKAIGYLDKEDYLEAFKQHQRRQREEEYTFDDQEMEEKYLAKMVVSKAFKPVKKKIKQYKFLDMPAIYEGFYKGMDGSADNWEEISKQTIMKISSAQMPYEDAAPYLYIQDKIEGKKSNTSIRHVFIDEAQDYSPLQFAYICELFPFSKMTLLGDINQAIYLQQAGNSTIFETVEENEKETFLLMKSYRSTRQIVEFTRGIIPGGEKIEAFNRNGDLPVVIKAADKEVRNVQLQKEIESLQNEGHQSIAVICKTAKESLEAFSILKEMVNVRLIEKGTGSFEGGIIVIPSYLAKGIEFDAVIIFDASEYRKERERKLFYTACTRAMHRLLLFSLGKNCLFIGSIDQNTYHNVDIN
ncbi:RNA polymerase recycling motor HelD [Cytobacillus sp. NCCP-133]|uniref:RNA polymerase recycling motor HelD n=1 Tax=Cytobacillus sp. NCCP-133 TaxID=766848 RepID=UPI00223024C3|nr:RNA polymerase recycling motor HelD [Cytobacillus sp. NCCP-133]GLB60841.1 helicase IV [Cytobacillus sp. NCCP-133]